MIFRKPLTRGLVIMFIAALLTGCAAPVQTPAGPIPTPPAIPDTPPPPPPTPQPMATAEPTVQTQIFKFVRTVQVTSDPNSGAAMGYIHYVPATDRFVVMLRLGQEGSIPLTYTSQTCTDTAYGYKEYTTDMEPTGKSGFISCASHDGYSMIVENDMYFASTLYDWMIPGGKPDDIGFRIEKFDAISWQRLAAVDIRLDQPAEANDGPTLSVINGNITVTGEYFVDGDPDNPLGRGSHHHFFTADLDPVGEKILEPPEYPAHCPEASMIQEPGGDILMFVADSYHGDLMVYRLDKDWKFKEKNLLREKAFFPTGLATDGRLYYVAYTDTSNGVVYRNVGVAAYDADWNTLQDEAITDFEITDTTKEGWNPSLMLFENRMYVSYLITELDPATGGWVGQAYVNIYELLP